MAFEGKDAGSGIRGPAGGSKSASASRRANRGDVRRRLPHDGFRRPAEGKVTVTARFATEEGGADITPDAAPELLFAVEIEELPEVLFSREGGGGSGGASSSA